MPGNPTVVFTKPREVIVTDEDKPSPGEGQLLVRTTRSLISTGTELTIFSGDFPDDSAWSAYGSYPFHAGYSTVGRVEAVGAGVREGWAGKRVATNTFHAMYNVVRIESAHPILHDSIPDEQAAFFYLSCIGKIMNVTSAIPVARADIMMAPLASSVPRSSPQLRPMLRRACSPTSATASGRTIIGQKHQCIPTSTQWSARSVGLN